MSDFRPINREMDFLMPSSVDEWLPQRHLARFVVEVIEGLELRAMTGSYRGSGEASYHPQRLLGLIIYGYATGMFSSRNLERATDDSVACGAPVHVENTSASGSARPGLPPMSVGNWEYSRSIACRQFRDFGSTPSRTWPMTIFPGGGWLSCQPKMCKRAGVPPRLRSARGADAGNPRAWLTARALRAFE